MNKKFQIHNRYNILDIYVLETLISTTGWNNLIVMLKLAKDRSITGNKQGFGSVIFNNRWIQITWILIFMKIE